MLIRQSPLLSLLIAMFVNLRSEGSAVTEGRGLSGDLDCLFSTLQYSIYLSAGSVEEEAPASVM